jgi:hypothetical protein
VGRHFCQGTVVENVIAEVTIDEVVLIVVVAQEIVLVDG